MNDTEFVGPSQSVSNLRVINLRDPSPDPCVIPRERRRDDSASLSSRTHMSAELPEQRPQPSARTFLVTLPSLIKTWNVTCSQSYCLFPALIGDVKE